MVDEELVPVTLVPVEVFGTACECGRPHGYGISDAVSVWSDCNRAIGHIYRRDDVDPQYRNPDEVIKILVPKSEMHKFDIRFGDEE